MPMQLENINFELQRELELANNKLALPKLLEIVNFNLYVFPLVSVTPF